VLSSQVRRAVKASTTLAVNLSAIENAALQNIAPGELALWQNKTPILAPIKTEQKNCKLQTV
jgi:hypothetical protein